MRSTSELDSHGADELARLGEGVAVDAVLAVRGIADDEAETRCAVEQASAVAGVHVPTAPAFRPAEVVAFASRRHVDVADAGADALEHATGELVAHVAVAGPLRGVWRSSAEQRERSIGSGVGGEGGGEWRGDGGRVDGDDFRFVVESAAADLQLANR